MIAFFLAALALIAVTLVFLLPPLLRKTPGQPDPAADDANLVVLRDQLRELQQDRDNGVIDPLSYEEARQDLRLRMVQEAGHASRASLMRPGRAGATPWLLAASVPLAALAMYVLLGNPLALIPTEAGLRGNAHQEAQLSMEEMVAGLAERLEARPEDAQGWDMLARSYNVMGEFDKASDAYRKLAALRPDDAQVLADYADTLAMASGQSLQGAPQQLIKRALALDPHNLKALALAGTAAFERREYDEAVAIWEKILPLAAEESDIARSTMRSIGEARRLAGTGESDTATAEAAPLPPATGSPVSIKGRVQVDPGLRARLADSDTVFVLARPQEGGPPLAVVRREVRDLPFDFELDERSGIMGGRRLSEATEVMVIARVSRSGKAERVPGEPETAVGPVVPGGEPLRLVLQ